MSEPLAIHFVDDGAIPNNPRLPVLIYRGVFDLNSRDPAAQFESLFAKNKWIPQWRNGIYDFHHYHSTAHEVLGIAKGQVRVMLGGEQGQVLDLNAGDVVVLPAGTGHKRLSQPSDLLVVGAYPPGQDWDTLCGDPKERPTALRNIAAVPLPESDPVQGKGGNLNKLWTE